MKQPIQIFPTTQLCWSSVEALVSHCNWIVQIEMKFWVSPSITLCYIPRTISPKYLCWNGVFVDIRQTEHLFSPSTCASTCSSTVASSGFGNLKHANTSITVLLQVPNILTLSSQQSHHQHNIEAKTRLKP